MTRVATLHQLRGLGVLATPPPPGGGQQLLTSCCAAFAACACLHVTSCVLLKVRVYLSYRAWSDDFPTGRGAPGLFCLAASMSTHPARHLQ
jgi:hypothetical protein